MGLVLTHFLDVMSRDLQLNPFQPLYVDQSSTLVDLARRMSAIRTDIALVSSRGKNETSI